MENSTGNKYFDWYEKWLLCPLFLLVGLSEVAVADVQQSEEHPFYAGAKFGAYFYDDGYTGEDFDDTAWGGYGGYRFNQYIGVEAEYLKLNEAVEYGSDFEGDLYALSVRPALPLGESWEIFAKVGWHWLAADATERRQDADGTDYRASASVDDDDLFLGLGVTWTLDNFHIRSEYQSDRSGYFGGFGLLALGIGLDF